MKTQWKQDKRFGAASEFLQDVIALVWVMIFPQRLVPVPGFPRRRVASPMPRRMPSGRSTGWLPLMAGFVLLAAGTAWAGQAALPAGVPNILDPEVRAHFESVAVANLRGNSDFPVVLLVNTTDEQPKAILLGLDARNGKDTWSLKSDPIILIMIFSDATTIEGLYVDAGFADRGKASGDFAAVDEMNSPALPDLLRAVSTPPKQAYM